MSLYPAHTCEVRSSRVSAAVSTVTALEGTLLSPQSRLSAGLLPGASSQHRRAPVTRPLPRVRLASRESYSAPHISGSQQGRTRWVWFPLNLAAWTFSTGVHACVCARACVFHGARWSRELLP